MRKLFTLFLAAFLCCTWTNLRADEVTVASDGADNSTNIPLDGSMANFYYQRAQIIYEAADLSAMIGSQINQMTFYLKYSETTTWGSAQFKVSLAEVSATDFGSVDGDAAFNGAELTQVYSGGLSVDGTELTILFDDPFVYNGGNLLFELQLTQKGAAKLVYFLGVADAEGPIRGILGEEYSSIGSSITKVGSRARMAYKTTFSYGPISTCTKPTGLIAYKISYNGATIGWTTDEAVQSYTLEYKLSSASDWTVVENASNGYVLNDLTENSTYNVRLKAKCSEESVSSYASTSFSTPCAPMTIDADNSFTEDFDAIAASILNPQIPECWDKIANGNYPYVSPSGTYVAVHSEKNCLYFYGGTPTTNCVIILPSFTNPYSELALSFWYKNDYTSDNSTQVQIGYMTDKRFASTFVAVHSLDKVTEYTLAEDISLADIPANAYLAIRLGNGTSSNKLYLDDLTISLAAPSCAKPAGLKVDDLTYNSAIVTWDKGSAESSMLQYKRSDEEEWSTVNDATSPYQLTDLVANTSYDLRIQNSCGEIGESAYASTSFTTPCAPFLADSENPFSEGFEDLAKNTIPDCWDNSEMNSPYGYKWGAASYAHTGSSCVRFNSSSANDNGNYNLLKTKPIHIGSAATLSFYYKNPVDATLVLYYTIDDGEQTLLDNSFTKQDDWTLYEHALPAACVNHEIKLIFKGISNGQGDEFDIKGLAFINIDDILITCEETCPKPKNLAVDNITDASAQFTWTAGASESEWQYICLPKNQEPDWNSEAVKSATVASVVVEELAANTNYTFFLRAKCSDEDYSAVASQDFKTECASSVATLTCGFEASEGFKAGEFPECWTTLFVTTPAVAPAVTTDDAEYGSQHLRITGSETGQFVILPKLDQEVKNYQISFKFKRTFGAALYLATLTDPENKATMKVFTSSAFSGGTTYTAVDEYEMTAARDGDYYLAFYYYTSGNATLYLDDIVVEPIPPCKAPTNLYESQDPTATTVGLAWTENGTATQWLIQLSDDNGKTWDAGTVANTNPFKLTNLTPDTHYKARIKAVCGEEESSKWSSIIDFYTEAGFETVEIDFRSDPFELISGTAILVSGSYNDPQHGYYSPVIATAVNTGNYKITVGNCQHSNQPGSVKDAEGSATLDLIDEHGQTITSFTTPKNCYADDDKVTSVWFVSDEDQVIRIVCPQYTPYLLVEQVESVPAEVTVYTLTFEADDAEGTAPAAQIVAVGESTHLPANRTLFKNGYTLTGWNDGANTYAPGAYIIPTADATLTAVFTANTKDLLDATGDTSVKWFFGESNGCPSLHLEGGAGEGFIVAQATVDAESQDVKLEIDATAGKFNNKGRGDKWAQVNLGTVFSFPHKDDITVDIEAYSGAPAYNLENGTLTVTTGDYFSYLQVTYPKSQGGGTAIGNTAADATAAKLLRDGQILILRGDKTYTITGQEVK